MILQHWRPKAKRLPDPTRAALPLRYTIIDLGRQGQPARYAMDAVCDDGVVRTFVVGPELRKESI